MTLFQEKDLPTPGEHTQLLSETFELESWQHEPYITRGHRRRTDSFKKCFLSLFHLHNELVNTHSHLWPSISCLCVCLASIFSTWWGVNHIEDPIPAQNLKGVQLWPDWSKASWMDVFAFSVFLLGATCCFGLSALYHCCTSHSPAVSAQLNRLDHLGVLVLISCATYPVIYFSFYCSFEWWATYSTLLVVLSLCLSRVVFSQRCFNKPIGNRERTAIFVSFGLSVSLPLVHAGLRDGWQTSNESWGATWLLIVGALDLSGALLYATRWPERLFPRRFDIFGASHQIFHFLIVLAAFAHWVALTKAFTYRSINSCHSPL